VHEATDTLLNRVKRVRVVSDEAVVAPPKTRVLRQTRDGREQTLTIDGFDPSLLAALGPNAEAFDVSLDDWFKDLVRGREELNERGEATCSMH